MEYLGLSLIAAAICLDITALGQFMVSRPIFCGPLFGFLLGDIKTGLWIGMILELMWVNVIPMGAAIPQDVTSVAILATSWCLTTYPGNPAAAILALLVAVPFGVVFLKIDIAMRYFNVRIVHWVEKGVAAGREDRIRYGIYLGLLLFFVKAFVFFMALLYPGQWLLQQVYPLLPSKAVTGFALAWKVLPVAGLALLLVNFRTGKFPCNRLQR